MKKLMTFIGVIIIFLISSLLTYFVLLSSGIIRPDNTLLNITVNNVEHTYDHNYFMPTIDNITLEGNLHKDDKIVYECLNPIVDANEVVSKSQIKVLNKFNEDVTKNYTINVNEGKIKVNKANLKVRLLNIKEDVNFIQPKDYEIIEGTLFNNNRLSAQLTNEGLSLTVIDANGNDVSNNYNISYVDGYTKNIDVTIDNITKVYDGEKINFTDYAKVSQDLGTNKLVIESNFSKINANIYDLKQYKFDSYVINSNGDILSNYKINLTVNNLEITKRKLNIKDLNYKATYGDDLIFDDYKVNGLLDSHNLELAYIEKEYIVGTTLLEIDLTKTKIYNVLNEDVTTNYEIIYQGGNVTIDKAALDINLKKPVITYGEILEFEDIFIISGIKNDDVLNISTSKNIDDAGEYYFTSEDFELENDNYIIKNINLRLIVEKREIKLQHQSISGKYKGTNQAGLLLDNIHNNGELMIIPIYRNIELKDAGKYSLIIEDNIVLRNNEDVSHNYKIIYQNDAICTIDKVQLFIETPKNISKIYDGKPIDLKAYFSKDNLNSLVNERDFKEIYFLNKEAETNANKYTTSATIYFNDEIEKNYYYQNVLQLKYEITKRPLTIAAEDVLTTNRDYRGVGKIVGGSLAEKDIITIITVASIKDNENIGQLIPRATIKDLNNNDMSANYEIKTQLGQITIINDNL